MGNKYDFIRYLAAKKTVDDRALNKDVWRVFAEMMPANPDILEVGAGIGTMVERLAAWGALKRGRYTAVDHNPRAIQTARQRLVSLPDTIQLTLIPADAFTHLAQTEQTWDVLIAHAFLDLVDIPSALPQLFSRLRPGGLFYFSLNFDGATILQPEIDPELDALIERLYHQTMDERMVDGRLSGDSRSGRHLFGHIRQAGGQILAAGSSDWVVFAGAAGYPADEAYFLHFIIHTIEQALSNHPTLPQARFADWIARRYAQIETGELVYIAHQIDFLGVTAKNQR
ncbi:MAG: methyltransferase domain-containing protein [Chloroflexi bacterium]|nr:methyltransferase domain-containing protein [Chloroflexota bacterium]